MVAMYSRLPLHNDIVRLLKLSADSKWLHFGKAIHAQLLIRDQTSSSSDYSHIIQLNTLIHLYAKCGQLRLSRNLFDKMPLRDIVSWNALMSGYLQSRNHLEVLTLFKTMVSLQNVFPNEYVFTTVLSACYHSGRSLVGMQCHGYLFKFGLGCDPFVKRALVHMYSGCFHVKSALVVLNTLPGNNVLCYNRVLNTLVEHGCYAEALEVSRRMVDEDEHVVWNNVTYVTVMGICAHIRDLKLGLRVHARLMTSGVIIDEFQGCVLIDMYGKCGEVLKARKVFDDLRKRNDVVVWTALMTAYLHNGYFEETLNMLSCMDQEDTMPNEYTFAVLLKACAAIAALRHGDLLHARVEKLGFMNHIIVGNALINMYSKSGSIDSSYNVFLHMAYRDIITWNAMICGYSHHGLGRQALQVFHDMVSAGEYPNSVTFTGVLSACAHLALVHKAFYYLNQVMKHFKIEPRLEHYTCVVETLCRAGLLQEAENFMKTTQVKWDVFAWGALLNACHVHRNYSLGERIAETILQIKPHDRGAYSLLSNMYAQANRWDKVVKIREMMGEGKIKNRQGVSWEDVNT